MKVGIRTYPLPKGPDDHVERPGWEGCEDREYAEQYIEWHRRADAARHGDDGDFLLQCLGQRLHLNEAETHFENRPAHVDPTPAFRRRN